MRTTSIHTRVFVSQPHLQSISDAPQIDRAAFREVLHKSFGMTDDMLMDRGLSSAAVVL